MSKADKVFYAKSGNFCIVRSGNEIKRSIFFKGKNVVIPENLKLELAKSDEILAIQETLVPNQLIFLVRSKDKLNSLITWDLKTNEEINFYQTDKPCILLPLLVENGNQVRPNMLLTDEFIINLETRKPIQIFNKRMLYNYEEFNHDLRAELITRTGDALIDPNFSGRIHFFHSLFDLKYLKQLR